MSWTQKNIYLLTLLIIATFTPKKIFGQSKSSVDATVSAGKDILLTSLAYQRTYHYGSKKRLMSGFGIRINNNRGSNIDFITAPAKVSEGNFFKKQNESKLDTLTLNSHNVTSVNLAIYLGYQINKKLSLEFNIDAVGLSFGPSQFGAFHAYSQNYSSANEEARVSNVNVLLTGDYDLGSLNSELVANYNISKKLDIKAGLSFVFSEYTTDKKLVFENDRFRNKSLIPSLGVRYKL